MEFGVGVGEIETVGVRVGFETSFMICGLKTVKLAAAPPARRRKIMMAIIDARENFPLGLGLFSARGVGATFSI